MDLLENKHLYTNKNIISKASIAHDIHKRIFGTEAWNKLKSEVQTTAKRSFIKLQKNFEKELLSNIKLLEYSEISLEEAKRKSYLIFFKYYKQAYMLGYKASGGGISQGLNNFSRLTANPLIQNNEQIWARTAAKSENKFMANYLQQINNKIKPHMALKTRLSMYTSTLESQFDAGRVTGSPNHSLIYWSTHEETSSCNFCQYMKNNSPWPKEYLITTPMAGFCSCLSNCRCEIKITPTDIATYKKLQFSLPNKERLNTFLAKLAL